MALITCLLFQRASTLGPGLGFSAEEIGYAKYKRLLWAMVVVFSVISFLLAAFIPAKPETGIWIGMPGFIFFGLNLVQLALRRRYYRTVLA